LYRTIYTIEKIADFETSLFGGLKNTVVILTENVCPSRDVFHLSHNPAEFYEQMQLFPHHFESPTTTTLTMNPSGNNNLTTPSSTQPPRSMELPPQQLPTVSVSVSFSMAYVTHRRQDDANLVHLDGAHFTFTDF